MTDGFPHWVALEDGAIVGVAVVKPPSHIYHLALHSDRQRTGIGRRLMAEALRFISDRCGRATVTVNSSPIADLGSEMRAMRWLTVPEFASSRCGEIYHRVPPEAGPNPADHELQ
jgi:ribosomal protein S18 acetylase RimI-like enzyme